MSQWKASSRGGSLSEFQRQLDKAIEAPDVTTDAFVAMVVDDQHWLIDLGHLSEASVPPELSQAGRCPAWVLGIGSFRGQVHTVLDMRCVFLGLRTINPQLGWATPLHERWPGALALLWPQMHGLIAKPELSRLAAPSPERWEMGRWADAQGMEWKEFDVQKFIASEFAGLEPK